MPDIGRKGIYRPSTHQEPFGSDAPFSKASWRSHALKIKKPEKRWLGKTKGYEGILASEGLSLSDLYEEITEEDIGSTQYFNRPHHPSLFHEEGSTSYSPAGRPVRYKGHETPEKENLAAYSNQETDVSLPLQGAGALVRLSASVAADIEGSTKATNSAAQAVLGKVAANVASKGGKVKQAASLSTQGYNYYLGLKGVKANALELLDSITLEGLLKQRKGVCTNTPVTQDEIESFITDQIVSSVSASTSTLGFYATTALAGVLSGISFLFPPLFPAAIAGVAIGCAATGIVAFISRRRVRAKIKQLFKDIKRGRNQYYQGVHEALMDKVNSLNEPGAYRKAMRKAVSKTGVSLEEGADNVVYALGWASTALWKLGRLTSRVAIGLDIIVSSITTFFSGVKNYRNRQKKMENIDQYMLESMVPNVSGRSFFTFYKESAFTRFLRMNQQTIAQRLGLSVKASEAVIYKVLNKIENADIKTKLKNACIKQLVKEQFCERYDIDINLIKGMDESAFDARYGDMFKAFIIEKTTSAAFWDTVTAGAKGVLSLATPVLMLSFFPVVAAVAIPLAMVIAGVGSVVTYYTAKNERKKCAEATIRGLNDELPAVKKQCRRMKQWLLEDEREDDWITTLSGVGV